MYSPRKQPFQPFQKYFESFEGDLFGTLLPAGLQFPGGVARPQPSQSLWPLLGSMTVPLAGEALCGRTAQSTATGSSPPDSGEEAEICFSSQCFVKTKTRLELRKMSLK